MVSIKTLILFVAIFFKGIYSFCIYNKFEENSINVKQENPNIPSGRRFNKYVGPGKSECCHYTETDCSPRGLNDDLAIFQIIFNWNRKRTTVKMSCQTGGAIAVHGSVDEYYADCNLVNGTKLTFLLNKDSIGTV